MILVGVVLLVVATLMAFFVAQILWRLSLFDLGGGDVDSEIKTHVITMGFKKIRPLVSETSLSKDGTFTIGFLNGVGTRIKMMPNTEIRDSSGNGRCNSIRYEPEGDINPGDGLKLTALGCPTGKVGEMQTFELSMPYQYFTYGSYQNNTEFGNISLY